jgi:aminoglycoside phosphotransferase (APT) family kinase protein
MSNQKVRKGEELNEVLLKKYLQENDLLNSLESQVLVTQFTHGYSNLTYLLAFENKEFVLRKPPIGAIKRGHDMHREFKVQSGVRGVFSKVPKMFAFSEDPTILGSDFYIMEKVDGIILNYTAAKQRNLSSSEYATVANSWMETMVALHAIDYKDVGLESLGKPEGYVSRQVANWGKQFLKVKTAANLEAGLVMEWMETHQPKEYQHCLIHNDYKYDNIVFKDDSWKEVAAVLDWEMATLGDPLMDLGTSLGYWTVATDHEFVKQGIPSPTVFEGNPIRSEIAVIAQQIYYRYTKGFTTDPRFATLNKAAELCCKLALKAIKTKSID